MNAPSTRGIEGRFSILLVCTGNICRSPVGERLLRSALDDSVRVISAGTYAIVGAPVQEKMAALIRTAGADPDLFSARQLSEADVRGAGLVLGMTREHRAATVELWPASVRHSFTLKELSRLLQDVDVTELPDGDAATRLSVAIPLAARQRRQLAKFAELDDIVDPYQGSEADYAAAFAAIVEATTMIARTA